jgi:hypothetical protein
MTFHSVGNGIIIPTDEVHDFSEGFKPPTSNHFFLVFEVFFFQKDDHHKIEMFFILFGGVGGLCIYYICMYISRKTRSFLLEFVFFL